MKILLILFVIYALVIGYIVYECLKRIVRPAMHKETELLENEYRNGFGSAIEAYKNEWKKEDFSLPSDDVILSGEIIRNPAAQNKAVIICHGQKVCRISSIKYAQMFYKLGYHVVIYDERHFGRSTGKYSTLGQNEAKDLKNVYEFTKQTFGQDCRIGIHGESMGAATALLSLKYIKPAFVVADCPFSDSYKLFEEFTIKNVHLPPILILPFVELIAKHRYDYDIRNTSPIVSVKESDVPICFMHGTSDGLIKCEHSKAMHEVCKNEKSRLHLFEGADHARSVVIDPKRYEKLLDEFVLDCENA